MLRALASRRLFSAATPFSDDLLAVLACPLTKTRLVWDAASRELISTEAGLAFPVDENGIVHMNVDGARKPNWLALVLALGKGKVLEARLDAVGNLVQPARTLRGGERGPGGQCCCCCCRCGIDIGSCAVCNLAVHRADTRVEAGEGGGESETFKSSMCPGSVLGETYLSMYLPSAGGTIAPLM